MAEGAQYLSDNNETIMKDDGYIITDNKNKAELLAQTFVKVHSTVET